MIEVNYDDKAMERILEQLKQAENDQIQFSLSRADLSKLHFLETKFFYDYTYEGENGQETVQRGTDFLNCQLNNTQFTACDLTNCNFSFCELSNTDFSMSKLSGVNFSKCIFNHVIFEDCSLTNVNFSNQDLRKANFRNAKLVNVSFTCCDLRYVDFTGADFTNCNFSKAKWDYANMTNAKVSSFARKNFNSKKYQRVLFDQTSLNGRWIAIKNRSPEDLYWVKESYIYPVDVFVKGVVKRQMIDLTFVRGEAAVVLEKLSVRSKLYPCFIELAKNNKSLLNLTIDQLTLLYKTRTMNSAVKQFKRDFGGVIKYLHRKQLYLLMVHKIFKGVNAGMLRLLTERILNFAGLPEKSLFDKNIGMEELR